MIPIVFDLGIFPIYSFGLMLVMAFYASTRILENELEYYHCDRKDAENIIVYGAMGGIIGAKLLSVFSNFSFFLKDPIGILFSGAGFVFYGGLIGGAVAIGFRFFKNKIPIMLGADITALAVLIGYAVGRIGCQLSGDGDYGTVTDSILGMSFSLGVVPTPENALVHPTPFYESMIALIIMFMMISLRDRLFFKYRGEFFAGYLIFASIERFFIEFFRVEPKFYLGLSQAQLISVIFIILGLFIFIFNRFLKKNKV